MSPETIATILDNKPFVCGALGALMPTVVRAYQVYSNGRKLPVKNWWAFSIICLLYAVFAGVFSNFLEPKTPFHAMWSGISFSVVVTNLFESGKGVSAVKIDDIAKTKGTGA